MPWYTCVPSLARVNKILPGFLRCLSQPLITPEHNSTTLVHLTYLSRPNRALLVLQRWEEGQDVLELYMTGCDSSGRPGLAGPRK